MSCEFCDAPTNNIYDEREHGCPDKDPKQAIWHVCLKCLGRKLAGYS